MNNDCKTSIRIFREKRNGDNLDRLLAKAHAENYIAVLLNKYLRLDDDEFFALCEVLEYLG